MYRSLSHNTGGVGGNKSVKLLPYFNPNRIMYRQESELHIEPFQALPLFVVPAVVLETVDDEKSPNQC